MRTGEVASPGAGSNLCARRDISIRNLCVEEGAEHTANGPWQRWVQWHAQRSSESSRVAAFHLGEKDLLRVFYPSLRTLLHLLLLPPNC